MELIKQCDNILRLVENSNNYLFEQVSKQNFPLLYSICVDFHIGQMNYIKNKIKLIKEHIKDCV